MTKDTIPSQRTIKIIAFIIITCVKILCIPSYRSTDFDVHRNWLAITRHLPLKEWYFDDRNGTTVHTLDYPPTFAYFEYIISNNPMTNLLLSRGILDERCLALLPDSDNEPSQECVVFHRMTVIISDFILWLGASLACCGDQSFLLIILNPGLLWLDHVHFQYNGAMLGILLASLGLLVRGYHHQGISYHLHHLGSAFLYSLLITLKHLYIPLAPLYFVYFLSNYCFHNTTFSIRNFTLVGVITVMTLIMPFIPFLLQSNPLNQMQQIIHQLFPFGRGLVHDYWAGNIWALYLFLDKVLTKIGGMSPAPEVTPSLCAGFLFLGLLPACLCAWRATPRTFIRCVVFSSLSSFMLSYHVHEKAIMTAIIPLTILIQGESERRLYFRMNVFGLIGLFPLLFRPVELSFKVFSYLAFMGFILNAYSGLYLSKLDVWMIGLLSMLILYSEILHPLLIHPHMEFLPLMSVSVFCALGLISCWLDSGFQLLTSINKS
jgi:alpha-1,3-glucosyltransferase